MINNLRPGALAGVKVLDLSRVLAGPYCTMILGDHGAAVTKVEPPQGDDTRDWGPPFLASGDERGDASYYVGVNRNKRSIALDLTLPEGRKVLLRLLEGADVLLENFKPGTMERWGLGYAKDLEPRFPRLVHCRISGFGGDGPLGGLPGYDAVLQAMSGLMSVNGDPSTGPLRIGTPIVDLATGLYASIAILMALQDRSRSGRGQSIDLALYDCGMSLLHPHAANYFLGGQRPKLLGNSHPNVVPCDKFSTRTGEIFVVIGNDAQFGKLMQQLGRPELAADPRFATNRDRLEHKAALTAVLTECLAVQDGNRLAVELLAAGVPAGSVLQVDEALTAEHSEARRMVARLEDYVGLGTPIKLSRTPGAVRTKPPRFAADSEVVLKEHGFTDSEIGALRKSGVLPATRKRAR